MCCFNMGVEEFLIDEVSINLIPLLVVVERYVNIAKEQFVCFGFIVEIPWHEFWNKLQFHVSRMKYVCFKQKAFRLLVMLEVQLLRLNLTTLLLS